jgi:hypothetical protein
MTGIKPDAPAAYGRLHDVYRRGLAPAIIHAVYHRATPEQRAALHPLAHRLASQLRPVIDRAVSELVAGSAGTLVTAAHDAREGATVSLAFTGPVAEITRSLRAGQIGTTTPAAIDDAVARSATPVVTVQSGWRHG